MSGLQEVLAALGESYDADLTSRYRELVPFPHHPSCTLCLLVVVCPVFSPLDRGSRNNISACRLEVFKLMNVQVECQRRAPWRELFSEEGQRYYYADTASSETSWDAPPHFRVNEWFLDATAYGVDVRTAMAIYESVDAVMGDRRQAQWKPTAELLIKVMLRVQLCTESAMGLVVRRTD